MEDIFINRLPTIDLHGYDTASAKVATNDFISDNIILKKDKLDKASICFNSCLSSVTVFSNSSSDDEL